MTKLRMPRSKPCDRREHIIAVASEVFLTEGYSASSMSTIAAKLGGSKATLYKYFPSKRDLLCAVIERKCHRAAGANERIRSLDSEKLELLLKDIGKRFLANIYEQETLDLHRLIQNEGLHFPELAEVFFRSGPDMYAAEIYSILRRFAARGEIADDDLELASQQFLGMLRGTRHVRFTVGGHPALDAEEIEHHAGHAARLFASGLGWSSIRKNVAARA